MIALVNTEAGLAELLPLLEAPDRIAIDTEADSLHCYFEKLCLIQISASGQDLLIDPLAGFSLEPLFAALTGKELIFHGADYDLRLLRRVGYGGPDRIFDTMIGARLCGITEFSLAALIERYFGLKLAKGSQKANWALRPLPAEMADYAVKDTHYLHELAEIFSADLVKLGRWEWFQQSCERAIRLTETTKERDAEEVWRIPGSGLMRGRTAAILRELWRWRDEEARAIDRPAFHVLHNEQLIYAANRIDQGVPTEFHHLRGSRLRRFEEAVDRALDMPETQWPVFVRTPRPRPSKEEEAEFRILKQKRDKVAADLQLDASLIAPKATLEVIASNFEEGIVRLMPWQRELLAL
ncbi:MAG: 3-5 exonuclease [Chthoniobacteraceae bacterium]|nr:3-5 exonuclease [Chthoniobacteraceae bacterium]